ncbi:MAG: hypothetical protein U0M50_10510, partial [Paramuribaculum sp.]
NDVHCFLHYVPFMLNIRFRCLHEPAYDIRRGMHGNKIPPIFGISATTRRAVLFITTPQNY